MPDDNLELNPADIIDRKAEQELFRDLVSFMSPARMLTICDRGDRGKSSLLNRLHYNCRYEIRPSIPACLIALDQVEEPSPFAFVRTIRKKFRGTPFPKFDDLDESRINSDPRLLRVKIDVQKNEGMVIGEQHVFHGPTTFHQQREPFTEEQQEFAREHCIEAFFDDLRAFCAAKPLVLILDAWERCNSELRNWIVDELLENHLFNRNKDLRPAKLAVVLSGRRYDKEERQGLPEYAFRHLFDDVSEYEAVVKSLNSLSDWEREHISAFLEQNGYSNVGDHLLGLLQEELRIGLGLSQALQITQITKSRK